jgi:hypothetical protein
VGLPPPPPPPPLLPEALPEAVGAGAVMLGEREEEAQGVAEREGLLEAALLALAVDVAHAVPVPPT